MDRHGLQTQFENGCLLPRQTIFLELHRLAAIFLASERFAELRGGSDESAHPIAVLQASEAHEIKRILITSAAAIRSLDDYLNRVSDLFVFACGDITCGDQSTGELSVRQACDKILHATRIQPDVAAHPNGNIYFEGNIVLSAVDPKNKKRTWEARINVIDFIRESTHYLEQFEV